MNTTTLAGAAGRVAGTTVRVICQIDWAEVAALVLDCLTALAIITLLAGRACRRAWDALPVLGERLGRWYARLLVPAPAVPAPPTVHPLAALATSLEALTRRELQALAGTRRNLPRRQLVALALAG